MSIINCWTCADTFETPQGKPCQDCCPHPFKDDECLCEICYKQLEEEHDKNIWQGED